MQRNADERLMQSLHVCVVINVYAKPEKIDTITQITIGLNVSHFAVRMYQH